MPVSDIESAEYETLSNLTEAIGPIGTGIDIIKFIYEFGKTSPIEQAIVHLRQEIELINARLDMLKQQLETVTQRLVKVENLARIRALQEHSIRLSTLAFQIGENPQDRERASEAAFEAGQRADAFLTDSDLWLWSDVRTVTPRNELGEPIGPSRIEPVAPDFKTDLAMPVYSMALATWVSAMMIDTQKDLAAVRSRYGAQLDRHIQAVSVRFEWRDDGREAVTIGERIRSRITCEPVAASKFAENGVCTFSVQCSNTIARTRRVLREFSVELGSDALCTINPEVVLQDEMEDENAFSPIVGLTLWEEMLRSVRASGHLPAEQFIGVFPTDPAHPPFTFYVVEHNGDLTWYSNLLAAQAGGSTRWQGPNRVGEGWAGPRTVFSGGGRAIYALMDDGSLDWFGHDGHNDGSARWRDPVQVGSGWNAFETVFPGGEGVIYGVQPDGLLVWHRHDGALTGDADWAEAQIVGEGWSNQHSVFSAGKGVIYSIDIEGVLTRHVHTGYLTGTFDWEASRSVGTGFANFREVAASASVGTPMPVTTLRPSRVPKEVLYAFAHDGRVLRYRLVEETFPDGFGFIDGQPFTTFGTDQFLEDAVLLLHGFRGFKSAFALLESAEPFIGPS